MNALHLTTVVALSSLLSASSALASEWGSPANEPSVQEREGDVGTETINDRVYPQETRSFPTWWFSRTNWKVHNPQSEWVQVHVWCEKYSYSAWYWIAPNTQVTGSWGCEGAALNVFNNASQYSNLWVDVTTW